MTEKQFLIAFTGSFHLVEMGNWSAWFITQLCENWHADMDLDPSETLYSTIVDAFCYSGYMS
ncbi:hypothetical protein NVP2275O_239 [Vibrio phage 2.275.O._10N.286.54.E11]|nr:hypothetical protein NVP2275O_239 [Vibrio phage 2.275.O._10N.286.54.E11]